MTLQAVDLFGVRLLNSSRDQLRTAVKNAGTTLISEAGEATFFDVYDSQAVLPGSQQLYLGFVKKDKRFAFAEYSFQGLQQPQMVQKLTNKFPSYTCTNHYECMYMYMYNSWKCDSVKINIHDTVNSTLISEPRNS